MCFGIAKSNLYYQLLENLLVQAGAANVPPLIIVTTDNLLLKLPRVSTAVVYGVEPRVHSPKFSSIGIEACSIISVADYDESEG